MALDVEKLLNWPFEELRHDYTHRDTILYALGLGLGSDPLDEQQLRFVYEKDLRALPTMAVVLAYPGFWLREPGTGVNWKKILHGEQGIVWHKPVPAAATVTGRTRVTGIIDKGAEKGSLMFSERIVRDAQTGEKIATLTGTTVMRGDGGFGGPAKEVPKPHRIPDRAPDAVCDLATAPNAALIYRLSGDYNPLHADAEVARTAGFPKPILHGLCSLGLAGHALLKTVAKYDPARFKSMHLRFTSPVFPGETIRTEMWIDGAQVSFRARLRERDTVVLDNGVAEIAPA
ncbi:MAG: MaoC family dehydratase N-terminal domain-containing protein [Methylobacteriaceae bacterium]|nr:MaoC family dehydratase N-terminal domain-containing protein [Methylobacteriaceae bacterium]